MSQSEFLDSLTDTIAQEMVALGMCDSGTYTASDGAPQIGRMFVNRGVNLIGQQGSVVNAHVTVRMVCADFVNPGELGASIDVDGDLFVIDSVVPLDGEGNDTVTVLVSRGDV